MNIPYSIVRRKVCKNKNKKCNHLKSYSDYELVNNKDNTEKEKADNILRYKKSCSNRNGEIKECCSKDMNDKLKPLLQKEFYGKTEYNRSGKLETLELCSKDNLEECGMGFKRLTPYELCKIPNDAEVNKVLDTFTPDCYESQCNPQEKLFDINGNVEENYTYEFDKNLSDSIKNNNLVLVKKYLDNDKSLFNRVLSHNSEGNTIYHEALKYNSEHVLLFLFKNANKDFINRLNTNGETILHMASQIDNPNILSMCLKLGSDINALNNEDETPLFYAVKSGIYNNVLKLINNKATIDHKNINDNTPFVISCLTPKRNINIVRLLVDNGADVNNTKDNKSILEILLTKKNIKVVDEEIRTYLQNIKIKELGIDMNKKLSEAETAQLEGILYVIEGKEKYQKNKKKKFTLDIEFNDDLKYPKDIHYPSDLKETKMKPYNVGTDNFSHEPYYQKYKDLTKDKMLKLKQIIILNEWNNKNSQDEKIQLIDDIMSGKKDFENYKHHILNENGLTVEQTHLLGSISDDNPFIKNVNVPSESHDMTGRITILSKDDKKDKKHNPKPYDIQKGKLKIKVQVPKDNTDPEESPSISEDIVITKPFNILDYFDFTNINNLLIIGIVIAIIVIVTIYFVTKKDKRILNIMNKY